MELFLHQVLVFFDILILYILFRFSDEEKNNLARLILDEWCWLGVNYNPLNSSNPFIIFDENDKLDEIRSFLNNTIIWEKNQPVYYGENLFAQVVLGANGKFKVVDENANNVYLVCKIHTK